MLAATTSIRELSVEEVRKAYLPLRLEILDHELQWLRVPTNSELALWDDFDEDAIQFGYFSNGTSIGEVRLIVRSDRTQLPSGPFNPSDWAYGRLVGEVSRLVVKAEYRGKKVGLRLLERCIQWAESRGVVSL